MADGEFDVFLSYRHQEAQAAWVRTVLTPRLRHEGIRVCLDVDTFEPGAPLVLEMARGVRTSRYTVAILTPAYLMSGFTELETALARQWGARTAHLRLVVVLREPCRPRFLLQPLVLYDMTDDAQVEVQMRQLVGLLRDESGRWHAGPTGS